MFRDLKFRKGRFESNRKKTAAGMDDNSVMFILSSLNKIKNRDTFYKFRQDSNFYYLTGLELERAVLAVTKVKGKTHSTLFRKVLDPAMEKWVGSNVPVEQIRQISGITDIRDLNGLEDFYAGIFSSAGLSRVYMYNEYIPELVVPTYTQTFASNLRNRFNFIDIVPLNGTIDRLRQVKSADEIRMIKRAVDITAEGFADLMQKLRPGITENECEAVMLYNYIRNGSVHPAFLTIAASGGNATVLHYEENSRTARAGEMVLIDTGAEYKNYSADITRTLPVSGRFTKEQKKFYELVLKAHDEVLKAVKPGVRISELQEITKNVLFAGLKKAGLVKEMKDLMNYYYHGVSHFLGLDTHDVGINDEPLGPGNVITVEPGLYIAEKNMGIRLENDILVTDTGCRNLSENIPVDPEEIEDIMNRGK